ncbi:MAG: amino acid ABC transporter permease [bacterium]|nr:amino acid ABC transporter permease [bacterium]
MYAWNWNVIFQYRYVFLEGALTTLKLALFVVVFGTILGILIGMVRRSSAPFLPAIAKVYILIFRAFPTLILLVWFYYVAPIIFGIQFSPFNTAVIALSVSLSAFVAETFRAAVESIPKSQFESGVTLGLSQTQTMFYIILPQAVKNMLPNLLGLYVTELKNTSLASVIAVDEILHKSSAISSITYRPLEIYTTVALIYLVIVIPFALLAGRVEKKINEKSRKL